MTAFTPKVYQAEVLNSIDTYFRACHEESSPATAFSATTQELWQQSQAYHSLPDLPPDMPYFCLRLPTGGLSSSLTRRITLVVCAGL